MQPVPGTATRFNCEKDEEVTMVFTKNKTNFLIAFTATPPNQHITLENETLTVPLNDKLQEVFVSFDFSGGSGGSYQINFTGSEGGSFTRIVKQPTSGDPVNKNYIFDIKKS